MRSDIIFIRLKRAIVVSAFISFTVFAQSHSLTSFDGNPVYPRIDEMLERMEQSCSKADLKINGSYTLLKQYKNKKTMSDVNGFLTMNQLNWMPSNDLCSIALAKNTRDGMLFIKNNWKSSAYATYDVGLFVGLSLVVLWYYSDPLNEGDLLEQAKAYFREATVPNESTQESLDAKFLHETIADQLHSFVLHVWGNGDVNHFDPNKKQKLWTILSIIQSELDQAYAHESSLTLHRSEFGVLSMLARLSLPLSAQQTKILERVEQLEDAPVFKGGFSGSDSPFPESFFDLAIVYAQRGDFEKAQRFILKYKQESEMFENNILATIGKPPMKSYQATPTCSMMGQLLDNAMLTNEMRQWIFTELPRCQANQ